jgi:predicted enzyme related to lactoylglutathione lyase
MVPKVLRAVSVGLVLASAAACTSCKGPPSASSKGTPAPVVSAAPVEVQTDNPVGRFVWHELTTVDMAASAAFYSEVVGWSVRWDNQDNATWLNEADPVGGLAKSKAATRGTRSYWTVQVLVDDVDETVRVARDLGGPVFVEPVDMPNGRFASIGDPKGPQIYVYRSKVPWKLRDATLPGEFFWNEFSTTDGAASMAFYGKLFGWVQISESAAPLSGKHIVFGRAGVPFGVFHAEPGLVPGWIFYIQIADLDASMKHATAKGGAILAGPLVVPDGHVAVLTDPQGAVFGLHESGKAQ